MRRRVLAAAVLAPVAALAAALPAQAAAPSGTASRTNMVMVQYSGNPAPLRALRSSTQTCSGTLVHSQQALVSGKAVAELDVYAKATNGGTIIACMKHLGVTRGVRLPTSVAVSGGPSMTSKLGVVVVAAGNFRSYAGPAAIGGVKGKCFAAAGSMVDKAGHKIVLEMKPVCTK